MGMLGISILFIGVVVCAMGQSTTTPDPGNETPAPIIPKLPAEGITLTTFDDWGWASNPAQMRHLMGFPGIDEGLEPGDSKAIRFTNPDIHLLSVRTDFRSSNVYMYDVNYGIIVIGANYSANMNTSELEFKIMHHVMSLGTVQVAYDWLSGTVYWTDPQFKMVVAASGDWNKVEDDQYKIILDKSLLDSPDGVAVDPFEGYLFVSDNGIHPKILRAFLDGRKPTPIVKNNLKSPMTLECDILAKRLYWIDSYTESILSVDYAGKKKVFVARESGTLLFDLAIFRDLVYVTDIDYGDLYTLDKVSGNKRADALSYYNIDEVIYGVTIHSNETEPVKDKDYCALKNCDHMCISTKYGAKCMCGEGYVLNPDTNKCDEAGGAYLRAIVYANASHVCVTDIRSFINVGYFPPKCIFTMIQKQPKATQPPNVPNSRKKRQASSGTTFEPESSTQAVPSSNQTTPVVHHTTMAPTTTPEPTTTTLPPPTVAPPDRIKMIELDMADRFVFIVTQDDRIYERSMDLDIDSDEKTLLAASPDTVTGLAFDPEDRNLFYSRADGSIFLAALGEKGGTEVGTSSKVYPKDLIVLKDHRLLAFIAGEEGDFGIYTMEMDGSNIYTVLEGYSNDIGSLVYDKDLDLFYFIAIQKGQIMSVSFNGTDRPITASHAPDVTTYILLEYHNYLFWVYSAGDYPNLVMTARKDRTFSIIGHQALDNVSQIVDVKILDHLKDQTKPSLCGLDNGGCSQICITKLENDVPAKECICKKGYTLAQDKLNCTSEPFDDHFLALLDWTHDELLMISLNTDELVAIPARESYYYMGMFLDPDTLRIWWSVYYGSTIYSSKLDGSDVQIEGDSRTVYPHEFIKDSSTGNMYYTSYYSTTVSVITKNGYNLELIDDFFYESVNAIEIHPGKGYLYYAVSGYWSSYIARSFMDGSNMTKILEDDNIRNPEGLAIDYINGYLYVGDYDLDTVIRCDLDGNDCITIVNRTAEIDHKEEQITDLVTDSKYLYYTSYKQDYIVRVNLEPPYEHTRIGGNLGLGKVNTISLYSTDNVNLMPVENDCTENDGLGDCSTICFPTPGGRTCACEDSISMHPDGRTCANVHLCTDIITHQNPETNETIEISFHSTCMRRLGSKCEYKCPVNYRPTNKSNPSLTCNVDGWDRETHHLCEELRCPADFKNGKVSKDCSKNVGSVCDFMCDSGYEKVQDQVFCKEDGLWHGSDNAICKPKQCVEVIQQQNPRTGQGIPITLETSCSRELQSTCQYNCPVDYVAKNPKKLTITCTENGWDGENQNLCEEVKCPETFNNGNVSNDCDRYVGSFCDYKCNTGFMKSDQLVFCKEDGTWHGKLCEAYKCDTSILHGSLDPDCVATVGNKCRFTCDKYYDYAPTKKIREITCRNNGWDVDTSALCSDARCDDQSLSNGQVADGCSKIIGQSCLYSCDKTFTNRTVEVVCKADQQWHPNRACDTLHCPGRVGSRAAVGSTCSREVNSVCRYHCDRGYSPLDKLGNITCLHSGKWNQTELCLEPISVSPPEAFTQAQRTGLIAGLAVLAIVILVLALVVTILYKRRRASSAYATASFKNGSNIAIENPGYTETSMANLEIKDDHPYSSVDHNQMQPVQFQQDKGDGGRSNPLYDNEPLPEVAQVEVNQDKTVLTYDSWLKEREKEKQASM